MSLVIVDGSIFPLEKAKISITDRGLLLGEGLFETLKLQNGLPVDLERHWQRLSEASSFLCIDLPLTVNKFTKDVEQLSQSLGIDNGVIRLTVTAGAGGRGLVAAQSTKASYIIQFSQLPLIPSKIRLTVSPHRVFAGDPLTQIKSLSYLKPILVKRDAMALGFDDGLILNDKGYVTETSCANFFIVKQRRLITPPVSEGLLAGTTRAKVLASLMGYSTWQVEERPISIRDLSAAESAFICNALIGIVEVEGIDDIKFTNLSIKLREILEKILGD